MITIVKLHKGQPLSQEQINEIEEAKKKTIVYDDDSPELTVTLFVVICINLYKSPLRLGQLLQQESSVSVYVVLPHKWIQQAIRL